MLHVGSINIKVMHLSGTLFVSSLLVTFGGHQENPKMLSHTYLYLVALILKIRKISQISKIFCLF